MINREDRRRAWLANEEYLGPLPAELAEPSCERCKDREVRSGYRLCKKCDDDDASATMTVVMACRG